MDADTLLNIGSYCETLLQDPMFQYICSWYETQASTEMLSTKPHEIKAREYAYAKVQAHREFLSGLMDFVKQKNQALEKSQPDHLDQIDNPAVHNIFD